MKAENDYKKQIRELQSALATERQKNTAMAKGLLPKEYLQNYARIQIEKDRENSKLLLKQHLQTHVAGYTPCCIEVFKNRPITLD